MSAIEKQKVGFSLRFRPLGKQVRVHVPVETNEKVVKTKEAVEKACRSGEFSGLSSLEKDVARISFEKSGFEVPGELLHEHFHPQIVQAGPLTVWQAVELFLNYPSIQEDESNKERHIYALKNIVPFLGKHTAVEDIWVPELRAYMGHRKAAGAANTTINREKATLSKLFTALQELRKVDQNPCRLVRRLSTKASERKVYINQADANNLFRLLPDWLRPMAQTVYYTAMRVGEAHFLERWRVDLDRRMIFLGPRDVKEEDWKKVPIHRELVPILESCLRATPRSEDLLFMLRDRDGMRPPSEESRKNPWRKACRAMNLFPRPVLTDLRHTWRRNAARSGIPDRIAEEIMGHWTAEKSVNRRYGALMEDDELLEAIDLLTFDHGKTHIWLGRDIPKPSNAAGSRPTRSDGRRGVHEASDGGRVVPFSGRDVAQPGGALHRCCDNSVTNSPDKKKGHVAA
jgi:integrase